MARIIRHQFGMRKDAEDEQWITINGAHVLVGEDGTLQGEVGAKISSSSSKAGSGSSKASGSKGASKSSEYASKFYNALKNGAGDDELDDIINEAANDDTFSNDEYSSLHSEMMDMYKAAKPLAGEEDTANEMNAKFEAKYGNQKAASSDKNSKGTSKSASNEKTNAAGKSGQPKYGDTTDKINPSWSDYDKTVAETQLSNYGKIFMDKYGAPIDNEFEVANLAGDDFYDVMTANQTFGQNESPTFKTASEKSESDIRSQYSNYNWSNSNLDQLKDHQSFIEERMEEGNNRLNKLKQTIKDKKSAGEDTSKEEAQTDFIKGMMNDYQKEHDDINKLAHALNDTNPQDQKNTSSKKPNDNKGQKNTSSKKPNDNNAQKTSSNKSADPYENLANSYIDDFKSAIEKGASEDELYKIMGKLGLEFSMPQSIYSKTQKELSKLKQEADLKTGRTAIKNAKANIETAFRNSNGNIKNSDEFQKALDAAPTGLELNFLSENVGKLAYNSFKKTDEGWQRTYTYEKNGGYASWTVPATLPDIWNSLNNHIEEVDSVPKANK